MIQDCALDMLSAFADASADSAGTPAAVFSLVDRCGCPAAGPRAAQALAAILPSDAWGQIMSSTDLQLAAGRAAEWLRISVSTGHAEYVRRSIEGQIVERVAS
jgi:hypothetical protein